MPPDGKEIKLGKIGQKASPSAGKNSTVVSVPCHAWKCIPVAISCGVNISEYLGVICYDR